MKEQNKKKTGEKEVKEIPTLLQAIERVVDVARDSKLAEDVLLDVMPETGLLAESFGITKQQAILFCICMEKGPRRVDYDDIACFLDISKIKALGLASDIDALVRRRLLKFRDVKDEDDFDVPTAVVRCLKHNEVYQLPKRKGLDCAGLFDLLSGSFEDLSDDAISPRELREELQALFDDNPQVKFVHEMKRLGLGADDMLLLTFFCHRLVNCDDDDIRFGQMEGTFDSLSDYNAAKARLRGGKHVLMKKKLIEHICDDGIADTSKYHLTAEAKRLLLGELNINPVEENLAGTLKPSDLTPKQMFYPKEVEKQVAELASRNGLRP